MANNDDVERLVLEMSADLKKLEKGLDRAVNVSNKRLTQVERRFEKAGQNMARSFLNGSSGINQAIAGIAVGAAIAKVGQYADAWTSARNALAAAGVPTAQLAGRQAELVALANETRAALGPTVELYTRLTRATEGLGANQTQVARATEIVNKAFKAGGSSAQEQAAGILQLGQALGSGVLQGDELRSIRENAPLVAKAIADEFGVTIGGLKDLGAEGKLTSDRVFAAILNGAAAIEKQFATTTPTIADSFNILRNEATQFIGELDRATGASKALSEFIIYVSENLDTLAAAATVAAAVIGGVLAGQATAALIASAAKAGAALGITQAAITATGVRAVAATASVRALNLALGFFGGPIGLAVMGVATAIGFLAANSAKAKLEAQQVADALDNQAAAANSAAEEQAAVGSQITETQKWAAGLTGEVDKLADAHYRAAAAAKAQAIETARLRLVTATDTLRDTRQRFNDRRRINANNTVSTPYGTAARIGGTGYNATGDARTMQSQEAKDLARSIAIVRTETNNLTGLLSSNLSDQRFAPPRFNRPTTKTEDKGGGNKGKDAEAEAKRLEQQQRQREEIAGANALEVARLRNLTDQVATLEREEMIRSRIGALIGAGLDEAAATAQASKDQADYDAARLVAIERAVAEKGRELDLEIAQTDENIELVRTLQAQEELRGLIAGYIDDGLSAANAETKALADQVRLEEARIRARQRYIVEAERSRQLRLAELRGDSVEANRQKRAIEISSRARDYRDQGGLSQADATARATAEVIEEARATAQGVFRSAFINGFREAIQSGDVLSALGQFATEASNRATEEILGRAADALFNQLAEQFPNLFDLGQELTASTAGATAMSTAITTAGGAAGAAMAGSIGAASTASAATIGAGMLGAAGTAAATIGAAIVASGGQAAAAMAAAIAAAGGSGGGTGQIGQAIASAFAGGRAGGGPVRYHMKNEQGPEPFVPTSAGVVFSTQAMRGLAQLGKVTAGQVGAGEVNLEFVNATGVPATMKKERQGDGSTKLTLEPLFEKGLEGAGRSGALKRAGRLSPAPTRRG